MAPTNAKSVLSKMARVKDFFIERVIPGYQELACSVPAQLAPHFSHLLLFGIFVSLRDLLEATGQGGNFFNINGFSLKANRPTRVLEKDINGRVRTVRIWVDTSLANPVLRISTSNGSTLAAGLSLSPGVSNEVGRIPPNTELWMNTTADIVIMVTEEG